VEATGHPGPHALLHVQYRIVYQVSHNPKHLEGDGNERSEPLNHIMQEALGRCKFTQLDREICVLNFVDRDIRYEVWITGNVHFNPPRLLSGALKETLVVGEPLCSSSTHVKSLSPRFGRKAYATAFI